MMLSEGMRSIDLNADLGEGAEGDEGLLALVSSANIACGFHAGDPHRMRASVRSAIDAGVAIGAHPGLPDRLGFGRRDMAITPEEAYDYTVYQVGALYGFVRAAGGRLRHVKPHGALYHMAGRDPRIAGAIVRAVRDIDDRLAVFGQSGSLLLEAASAAGLPAVSEAFADRRYRADGILVPRSRPNAVIASEEEASAQAVALALRGEAPTEDGGQARVQADTICVHGDGPHAAKLATAIRRALADAGIRIAPKQT